LADLTADLDDAILAHRRAIVPWLAALVVVGAVSFVLHFLRRYISAKASLELMHSLRVAIQRRLHTLDLKTREQLSIGDITARAAADVTLVGVKSATPEPENAVQPGRLRGEIRFEDVRFAYAPETPEAVRGVDIWVRPGETVGLVGTTGAGKSTLVKLAARFYDPTSGRITIDGIPPTQIAGSAFRKQLGYVPQEAFLFSGTVSSNIRYGRPEATDLEVERAARAVGAHDFIRSLPQGNLTPVSASGSSLSQAKNNCCVWRVRS
jgi:ABC-type multidrug transport system fused ATPase/permease subunit